MIRDLISEIRYGVRSLSRQPGFALVALVTLALAIGANTLLFSVVDGVLIQALPYPDADRLVELGETRVGGTGARGQVSFPNFTDWRDRARSIDGMGAMTLTSGNLTGSTEPMRLLGGLATPEFMRLTGLVPQLGRGLTTEEALPGAAPVAILSHALWQQGFGSDPGVIGRTIQFNGARIEVVGVLGEGARFSNIDARLWLPLAPMIGNWVDRREVHTLTVVGRLAPGVTVDAARLELSGIGAQLRDEHLQDNAGRGVGIASLQEALVGNVRQRVWILMGTVAVVLLIACANVANLLLARLNTRRHELAVRQALGAGRWRVTRVFLTESLLLTLTGGAVGVALTYLVFGAVQAQLQGRFPRADAVTLNGSVLAYALMLSVGSGVVFGLLPWFASAHEGPARSLGSSRRPSAGRRGSAARSALSVFQIAGSVVLLVGAGLLIRSFVVLQNQDVGFEPANLATVGVSLSGTGRDTEDVIQFYRDLPERLEALPGVVSASAVNSLPISGGDSNGMLTIEGNPFDPGQEPAASFRRILPGYFATTGIPLLHGREFRSTDLGDPMTVIIAESMAKRYWDSPVEAVGVRIKIGTPEFEPWLTVVGVVGDVRNVGVATEPALATYEPHTQRPWSTMSLVIRTEGDPARVMPLVRKVIREAGGEVPVFGASTLTDRITESLKPRRLILSLMASFAALALVISSVGVYGVLSYLVSQRTNEFGIRMALGASRGQVTRLVARQGARLVGAGLLLGLIGAALLGSTMSSLVHGVSPRDGVTYIVVPVVLGLVSILACYLPARRATGIDPVVALRED